MKRRGLILVGVLVIFSMLLAACGGGAAPAPAAEAPAAEAPAEEAPAEEAAPAEEEAPAEEAAAEEEAPAEEAAAEEEAPAEEAAAAPEATPTEQVLLVEAAAPSMEGRTPVRWFVGLGTGTDPAQIETQQNVVAEFNESQEEIELILEVVAYNSARDILATQIASGNPPDIVGPVGQTGANAFYGQWLDLADLVESTGHDLSQYDAGAVEFFRFRDEGQVGLPFASFPSFMYFQRDMFDEAELNYPPQVYGEPYVWPDGTEAPWNFDTVRELGMILTVDANGVDATQEGFDPTQIVQYGYVPQYQDIRAIGSYWGAGNFLADDGQTFQIPPQWEAAWRWDYAGMWTDHFIPTDPVIQSPEFGAGNPFNSGKIGMAITHLWYTCCIGNAGDNWDIAVMPANADGVVTSNFNADTFRILAASKNPEAAFEVLTYLVGPASLDLLAVYGGMPARLADQDQFFANLDERYPQGVNWQVAKDSLQFADNPTFEAFMPNFNEAVVRYNALRNLMLTTPDLDLDAELATFATEMQAIFDRGQ